MTTEPHHRMKCTQAQLRTLLAILDYVKDDGEYDDLKGNFKVDGLVLTADRISWNRLVSASDIYAVHVEREMFSCVERERKIREMFADKASVVMVEVKELKPVGCLF